MERTVGTQGLQHVNYSYDNTDQLTAEASTETTAIANVPYVNNTYAYDAMGNRSASVNTSLPSGGNTTTSSATKTHNPLNQITAQTVVTAVNGTTSSTRSDTYGYDNAGNLNTISNSVDSSGTTYVYDGLNRLVNVIQKNAAGTNTTKSEFVYDGMSRKVISREYTWNGSAWVLTPNSEVRRIYDGMDVIQERDASNNVITKYTRAGNIGGLLSKSVTSNSWSTRYDYFYHYDGSGNVTQMTDVSQNTVAEYAYDAYGNTTRIVGTQAAANLYRFSTKEFHNASGLYDYGFRFYSPSLGRWINRDPIEEDGGINLYEAFGNSPTNYGDLDGNLPAAFINFLNRAFGSKVAQYMLKFNFGCVSKAFNETYVNENPPSSVEDYFYGLPLFVVNYRGCAKEHEKAIRDRKKEDRRKRKDEKKRRNRQRFEDLRRKQVSDDGLSPFQRVIILVPGSEESWNTAGYNARYVAGGALALAGVLVVAPAAAAYIAAGGSAVVPALAH